MSKDMDKDMDKKFSRLTILYVMKCAISYVLFLLLMCMPLIGANATDQTQIPIDSVKMLKNYPLEFGNTAFTIYFDARDDYEDVSLAEIEKYAKQSHGNGYLYLALDEMFNDGDGSETTAWRHISTARRHGSLDAMVLTGYAYEYGLGGYKQNIDLAAKLFRKAASPLLKRTSGNEKTVIQTPNHGNVFQLANFLRRHPQKQISDNEADMIEEEAQRQFITAMNMKANRKKSPELPKSDAEADKIAQHYLTSTEPNIAKMRLELANYFMDGPVLNQFSNSKSNAFKLRESVYREFNDDYGEMAPLNLVMGNHYINGWGVEKNPKQAIMHFQIAAEEGDLVSIINYAVFTLKNEFGVIRDGKKILKFLEPTIGKLQTFTTKRSADIAYIIGVIHGNGYEVPIDIDAYYFWSRLGLDFESRPGIQKLIDEYHATLNDKQRIDHEQAYQAFRQEHGLERTD